MQLIYCKSVFAVKMIFFINISKFKGRCNWIAAELLLMFDYFW
jgi:hypothetical protein